MKRWIPALVAGALFGVGLVVSGMTQASKVLGFLDVAGHWDPSLLFVMGGAVGTHFLLLRLFRRQTRPFFADEFHAPAARAIDLRLIAGSALFGVGWGMGGFCPGPAIVSVGMGALPVLVTVVCMTLGAWMARRVLNVRKSDEQSD